MTLGPNLPDSCLRGITKTDDITSDGKVAAVAFYPSKKNAPNRPDGASETSINWEDDGNALPFSLQQFPNGVIRVLKVELDRIKKAPTSNGEFDYERAPLPNHLNDYHGNLLFQRDLPQPRIKMISSVIAMFCESVIR